MLKQVLESKDQIILNSFEKYVIYYIVCNRKSKLSITLEMFKFSKTQLCILFCITDS